MIVGGLNWATSQLLAHELGHALGYWGHPWWPDAFDDTYFPDGNLAWLPCDNISISNNIMGYNICRNYLSPKQMGYCHMLANSGTTTKFLTFCDYDALNSLTVNSNQTWITSKVIGGDLIIKSGNTLIVNCTVSLPQGGRVIVERGAKLIVDGGVFTNLCGGNWYGIEVWGNPGLAQSLVVGVGNPTGIVELKNGAIIENSIEGIITNRANTTNYMGGVLRATNSTFRNNVRAIQFLNYGFNNLSYFRNCDFQTNSAYLQSNPAPDAFVKMYGVKNISLQGCRFVNSSILSDPYYGVGSGIVSIDAKYFVGVYCASLNCPSPVRSKFENLFYGVNSSASNPLLTLSIDRTDFVNCERGALLTGMDYATVTRNNFTLRGGLNSYGLYLDACSGFMVEENNFSSPADGTGLFVRNSNSIFNLNAYGNSNIIYNNTFTNCFTGSTALDDNNGPYSLYDGLRFNCNDYTNGNFDIYVTGAASINTDIGTYQSTNVSATTLARNRFLTNNCIPGPNPTPNQENQFGMQKISPIQIKYYSNSDLNTIPQCYDGLLSRFPQNIVFNKPAHCPSSFSNCYANLLCLTALISSTQNQIAVKQGDINNGNRQYLFDQINGNTSPGNLKNILLESSPYLSDAVLIAYLQRAETPPLGHIKEIIIANSPVTVEVKAIIDAMNLPNGIKNEINYVQIGVSEREQLETEIGQLQFDREMAVNQKIRIFLNDTTISYGLDSVIAIIKNEGGIGPKCRLASAYIANGDLVNAQTVLDSLYQQNITELDNFCALQSLLIELNQAVEGCMRLQTDTSLTRRVTAIAVDTLCSYCVKSCENAQSLLRFAFSLTFPEWIVIPEPENNLRVIDETTVDLVSHSEFFIYPNPTSGDLYCTYKLPDNTPYTIFSIYDLTGRLILSRKINNSESEFIINTSSLNSGMYYYSVNTESILLQQGKF